MTVGITPTRRKRAGGVKRAATEDARSEVGRDFAAWIGLTPKDHSTTGKVSLGVNTRAGDEMCNRFLQPAQRRAIRSDMVADLTAVLRSLYEAGAEDVPAHEIDWRQEMTPALMKALDMGYIRYRERGGVKHFSLTKFGYEAIGIEPPKFSPFRIVLQWLFGRCS